jgi:hypothetical protein
MSVEDQIRVAYYLRVSTETQELDDQRAEILPFIKRRGWKLVQNFEDVMSGGKSERDRPRVCRDDEGGSSKKVRRSGLLGIGQIDP